MNYKKLLNKKNLPLYKKLYHDYMPYDLRAQVACKKALPLIENKGVLFIHIPKSAGSSVNKALYGRNLGHFTAEQFSRISGGKEIKSFSILRDPWSRTFSAYNFAKILGTSYVRMSRPWLYKGKNFETFEGFVKDWLPCINIETCDYIFRKQSYFIKINGEIAVNKIGFLEKIDDFKEELKADWDLNLIIPKMNTSNEEDFRKYYTPEMIDIVSSVYKDDVVGFNYTYEG